MQREERAPDRVGASSTGAPLPVPAARAGDGSWRRRLERRLGRRVLARIGDLPASVVLPGGTAVRNREGPLRACVHIHDPWLLLGLVGPSAELCFGDAYADGRVEVQGDLLALMESVFRTPTEGWMARAGRGWQRLRRRRNSMHRARANARRHYDLGNDFYALWLDREMVYTCAYFPSPEASLEEAQRAKMEHVARKLRLRPGEAVVEAGCGWGALALHLARHHGVRVRACNVSREQIAWARERARREGLAGSVEFVEDDYRNLTGRYDAFVSVGMLEHVGPEHYGDLRHVIDRTLAPHGRGLLHAIGRNRPAAFGPFVARRIFPGAYPPSLREMLELLEPAAFSVLDVENLRLHYARTLEHWLERFEAHRNEVVRMFDEPFARMWRLYLTGSIAGFRTGTLQLFQVLFARGSSNDVPWTRADLYR